MAKKYKQYKKLDYEAYERTLFPFCVGTFDVETQVSDAKVEEYTTEQRIITEEYLDSKVLLVSGLNEEELTRFDTGDGGRKSGIGKDILAKFRNGTKIYNWITTAYATKDRDALIKMVDRHFQAELMPYLSQGRSESAKRAIFNIIKADKEIPPRELAVLKRSYSDDNDRLFLAKSFIFAMIRDKLPVDYEYINESVERVLSDIKVTGRSTLLNGLIDSIYECAVEGLDIFDRMPYYQEDIIKFVLGVLPIIESLDEIHREKFMNIRKRALEYEMNGEFMAGVANACNALFKKYGIGDKEFEVSQITWTDNVNTLDIQLRNKVQRPIVVCTVEEMSKVKTAEDFARVLGIKVEDFEKYGFDINDFSDLEEDE